MPQETSVNIKALYSEHVKDLKTYIMFRIKQKMLDLKPELDKKGRSPLNMSIGAPTDPPPDVVIESLKEATKTPSNHMYSTSKGEPVFLEAVASRMKKRFGVELDPKKNVCSLIGSKEGLVNLFRAFLTPAKIESEKEIIMVPDPGYASYAGAIETLGGIPWAVQLSPENNYLPDPEEELKKLEAAGLDPKKVKMFVLNYPNNPTGYCAELDYYQKVVDFGLKHNILICSDLAYADMSFGDHVPPSVLEAKGAMDIAIECHSLSKPYSMTGWRIGFAVGNADAVDILCKVKSATDTGVFKAVQVAGATALTDPAADAYIEEKKELFKNKQALMVEGFKKLGWPISLETVPQATFYLWLEIPPRYENGEVFCDELLEKSGIVAVPGSAFGKYADRYFRLSLVLPEESLQEVITRMESDGFRYE